ncbi:MAG TPA: hypothetical protein VGY54_25910 [Polyangiaceae bacterium]|jgi:hypothetical protein|nr:hypothetical protein [Polyangiaceae bacterium]
MNGTGIARAPEDRRGIVGVRFDWLSFAFRVSIPIETLQYLKERADFARKHGKAGVDVARELWDMRSPRAAGLYFLESEGRGERAEIAPNAVGAYVDLDGGAGEIIPGWTFVLHASGAILACKGCAGALARAWQVAVALGPVHEARARRADLTVDCRGVPVAALDLLAERRWKRHGRVTAGRELDDGHVIAMRAAPRAIVPVDWLRSHEEPKTKTRKKKKVVRDVRSGSRDAGGERATVGTGGSLVRGDEEEQLLLRGS